MRLSQQGQLWWRTYDLCSVDGTHISELTDEIDGIIRGSTNIAVNVGAKYGIYKIMYYAAPDSVVHDKLESGSRYTEAGFATAYYYAGVVGVLVFAVIMGIIISLITNALLKSLCNGKLINVVLWARLLSVSMTVLSMHTFVVLFDAESIVSYAYLILATRRFKFPTFKKLISQMIN